MNYISNIKDETNSSSFIFHGLTDARTTPSCWKKKKYEGEGYIFSGVATLEFGYFLDSHFITWKILYLLNYVDSW